MKGAVADSRRLDAEVLEKYLPEGITEIISGGASGADGSAWEYALSCGIFPAFQFVLYDSP